MPLKITVDISDADVAVLKNDILDPDEWVQKAVAGKINQCRKRMANTARDVLIADKAVDTMPATTDGLIDAYMARPDYKNRAARDAEAEANEL